VCILVVDCWSLAHWSPFDGPLMTRRTVVCILLLLLLLLLLLPVLQTKWLCSVNIVKVCDIDPYETKHDPCCELEQQKIKQTSDQALLAQCPQNESNVLLDIFSHQLLSIVLGFVVRLGIYQRQIHNATALRAARARASTHGCIAAQIVRVAATTTTAGTVSRRGRCSQRIAPRP
jgi:hypothetical protein